MKSFTNEQITDLMGQTTQIISEISQGKDTRTIMAQLYVENLDCKTMDQGLAVADKILESVKKFDADYTSAREDLDGFINSFQDKAEEGMTVCERCNYWLKLATALTAAGEDLSNSTLDREKVMEQLNQLNISEEEATEEKAKQLRLQAFEALKNSGILVIGLKDLEEDLSKASTANEAAGLLLDLGSREVEYRAIMAMLAYTQVKTGQFDNVPVEMTAPQITAAVCAGVEEARIAEGVENGSIFVDVAAALLGILGSVVIVKFIVELFSIGSSLAIAFFPGILAIPACLMLVFGLFRLGNKCTIQWLKDSNTVVKMTASAVKLVFCGIKAVFSYVIETVIPGVLKLGKKLWSRLTGKNTAEQVDEEIVEEQDAFVEVRAAVAN